MLRMGSYKMEANNNDEIIEGVNGAADQEATATAQSTQDVNTSQETEQNAETAASSDVASIPTKKSKKEPDDNDKEKKKRSPISIVAEILIYAALIFICIYVVPEYVLQRTAVSGDSMEDTLHDGESMLVDKVSYLFHDPERYDIIVFYPMGKEVDDSEYYVKRVYGLPGETIQIKDNTIYINGKPIDDPYAKNAIDSEGIAKKPYKIKEGEFFVLGDNREVSLDSRKIRPEEVPEMTDYTEEELEECNAIEDSAPGPVKKKDIAGKVFFRIWPLSEFGGVK